MFGLWVTLKITPIKSAVFQINGGVGIAAGDNIMAKVEKNLLEKFGQERIRQEKCKFAKARKMKEISRKEKGAVYIPPHVSLSQPTLWHWARKIYRQGHPDVYKHIVKLLNRYVDALKKEHNERQAQLKQIADEIHQKLIQRDGKSYFSFLFNPDYEDLLPPESQPFYLVPPSGVAGMYESIARFLDSEYVH